MFYNYTHCDKESVKICKNDNAKKLKVYGVWTKCNYICYH